MKRELVMLAKKADRVVPVGMYMSTKLDGCRAIWDGGISRGLLTKDVPYANTIKDSRYINEPIATGLWSRYGNVVHAPDWWLDRLPTIPLDGELYAGAGNFQLCRSIVSRLDFSGDWSKIEYRVLDTFDPMIVFGPGIIRVNGGMTYTISNKAIDFLYSRKGLQVKGGDPFKTRLDFLRDFDITLEPQEICQSAGDLEEFYNQVLAVGEEGVVLKAPTSLYVPKRSSYMLKKKPFHDAEGIIVGWVSGKETDKGSRNLGRMGSLRVSWNGKVFNVSGFTDREREVEADANEWALKNPDTEAPKILKCKMFRIGNTITFKYRELTDEAKPKEARYWRHR